MLHPHHRTYRPLLALIVACASSQLHAQQVEPLNVGAPPPDLINSGRPATQATAPVEAVDLGQAPATAAKPARPAQNTVAGMSLPAPLAGAGGPSIARAAAARATLRSVGPAPLTGTASAPAERAVFAREPVRVNLTVGQERLVTLPADALLHVPSDIEAVARVESIGGTLYVTALVPFTPIRIVAELVDSGQQIPLDLVATKPSGAGAAGGELQVSVVEPGTVAQPTAVDGAAAGPRAAAGPEVDMVQLTRYAARQLYAPRRLASPIAGVSQVAVTGDELPGLVRGAAVQAVPVGQWRAGGLTVTAVRITNRSRFALEVPLESLRGRWLAATAQHGRIGPAGSDTDTTAIYLVCERAFESCL
ncbi:TIGR03749 family integrating conjugative element protein [Paracidovorax oryzae]|uniref:TIGR03749 family integrating conjugative element protein n=1 Tax=Paracidovorax oryzae TaxID=862720 RepID=UPI000372B5E2|nr:TIGR03749 family integrating conjugative element protein [Paracidovorax oryzae]